MWRRVCARVGPIPGIHSLTLATTRIVQSQGHRNGSLIVSPVAFWSVNDYRSFFTQRLAQERATSRLLQSLRSGKAERDTCCRSQAAPASIHDRLFDKGRGLRGEDDVPEAGAVERVEEELFEVFAGEPWQHASQSLSVRGFEGHRIGIQLSATTDGF